MNDFITASVVWISIGAVWTYFSDRRAYNEGMIDAIVLHNRGELTYKTYTNEEGETMVEIKVGEDA
jgi:predicted TIM-barrel enzyme